MYQENKEAIPVDYANDKVIKTLLTMLTADENVQAVVLNGSRTNPRISQDPLQDYDVAVYVNSVPQAEHFLNHTDWPSAFGTPAIGQKNQMPRQAIIHMVQFSSGLRIDLSVHPLENLEHNLQRDSLSVLLFHRTTPPPVSPPSEVSYYTPMPSQQEWEETLNELWWIMPYVGKALWRGETTLASYHYHNNLLVPLTTLLVWQVGSQHRWQVNTGLAGRWLPRYLPTPMARRYQSLCFPPNAEALWQALTEIGDLVREVGVPLSETLGYPYPAADDQGTTEYLRALKILPKENETGRG